MNKNSILQIAPLMLVRGIAVILQALMQLAIARVAGSGGIGLMQLYQTWTCVLGETNAMGLPTQTLKYVSVNPEGQETRNRLIRSLKFVSGWWLLGSLVATAVFAVVPGLMGFSLWVQLAFIWSILCFSVLRISAEALKAIGRSGQSIFAENAIAPLLMILFCLALILGVFKQPLGDTQIEAQSLIIAASLFATIAAGYSLARSLHYIGTKTEGSESKTVKNAEQRIFSSETRFFWGTAILSIGFLNLPFLLMPYFGSLEDIGLFALAFKLINPISTILIMLGAFFTPRFARAAANSNTSNSNNGESLKGLLFQSQWISVLLYLPVLLPILIFSDFILAIFGPEFVEAKPYLYLLAIAHLVNAVTGLSGNMLNMIGLGKREFQGSLIFFSIALLTGVWAGLTAGLFGIALVYGFALAGKNIWSYGFAIYAIRSESLTELQRRRQLKRTVVSARL